MLAIGELEKLGLDEKKLTEDMKKRLRNMDWLYQNYDDLRKIYPDKYVTIDGGKVIDSDNNINHLLERIKKKEINLGQTFIKFIHSEVIEYLL